MNLAGENKRELQEPDHRLRATTSAKLHNTDQ